MLTLSVTAPRTLLDFLTHGINVPALSLDSLRLPLWTISTFSSAVPILDFTLQLKYLGFSELP